MKIKKYQQGFRIPERHTLISTPTTQKDNTRVTGWLQGQNAEAAAEAAAAEQARRAAVVQQEKEALQRKYGNNTKLNTAGANNNTNIVSSPTEQQALRFMQYEPYPGAAYEYTQDYRNNTPFLERLIYGAKKAFPLLVGHHPDVYEGTGIKRVGSEGGYYTGAYVPIKKETDALGNVTSVKTPLAAKIGNIVMDSALLFDMGLSGLKAVAPSTYRMADQAVTSLPVAVKLRKGINKVDPASYDLVDYNNYKFLHRELSTPGYSVHVSPNYITESRVLRNGKTNPIELKAGHSNGTYWVPGNAARSEVEGTNKIWLYEDTPYHIHYGDKTFIQVPSKDLPYRPPQANTLGIDRIDLTKAEKIFQRNNVTNGIDRVIVTEPRHATWKEYPFYYDKNGKFIPSSNYHYRRGWGINEDALQTGVIRVPEGDYKTIALKKYPWLDNGNPFSTTLLNHNFPYFSKGSLWPAKFGREPADLIVIADNAKGAEWVKGGKWGDLLKDQKPSKISDRSTPLLNGETNKFPTERATLARYNERTKRYEIQNNPSTKTYVLDAENGPTALPVGEEQEYLFMSPDEQHWHTLLTGRSYGKRVAEPEVAAVQSKKIGGKLKLKVNEN